jgi:hypothetical protein
MPNEFLILIAYIDGLTLLLLSILLDLAN